MADPVSAGITVEICGGSDIGRVRSRNEDHFLIADVTTSRESHDSPTDAHADLMNHGVLAVVADGMGGAAAGDVASQMATSQIYSHVVERWSREIEHTGARLASLLKEALEEANDHIHVYASSRKDLRGMGTTATAAGLFGDHVYLAHVGDSRAYLVRQGQARQLTRDHSLIQRLVESGDLTEEEAARGGRRNALLQALGPAPGVMVDLTYRQLRRGDVLLLCSDGLTTALTKEELARVVTEEPTLARARDRLIGLANARGGLDNTTVILARLDGDGLQPASGEETAHGVQPISDPETSAAESPPRSRTRATWRVMAGGLLAAGIFATASYIVMRAP
jgi:PPM family protein phosphatase